MQIRSQPKDAEDSQHPRPSRFSSRAHIITAVHSPLGFFVLALLIVEAFLFGVGMSFGLSDNWKIAAICLGILLFLTVFFTVVWLVIKYPRNLVFSEESHVQYDAMGFYGREGQSIDGSVLKSLVPIAAPSSPTGQLPSLPTNKIEGKV